MLNVLQHFSNILAGPKRLITPEGADCTCGKCYSGWYSPRMEFLIKSEAHWVSSLLEGESFTCGERGVKYFKEDFRKVPPSMFPFEFPREGYVKSFLMGYRYSIDRIYWCRDSPPFMDKVAYPNSGEDQRMWFYFIEKGGEMDWALRYCLAQVKDNYSERLEMHFTELQTLPLCNNDWKFDLVAKALFYEPTDLSNDVREQEKLHQQLYESICEKMKNVDTSNEAPKFKKIELEVSKGKQCDHKKGRSKICFACRLGTDAQQYKKWREAEMASITFTKCPHSGRLLNWEGMCQGCHMRTTTYPLEWHLERLTEHRKSHLQLITDLISLPFNSHLYMQHQEEATITTTTIQATDQEDQEREKEGKKRGKEVEDEHNKRMRKD